MKPWEEYTAQEKRKMAYDGKQAGISAGEISRRMTGSARWRNAICGLWYRMGLSGGGGAARIAPPVTRKRKPRALKAKALNQTKWHKKEAELPVEPIGVDMDALSRHHCRWPLWDNRAEPRLYCGLQKHEGSSYCEEHLKQSIGGMVWNNQSRKWGG